VRNQSLNKECSACRKPIPVLAKVCFHCSRNVWIARWLPIKTENLLNAALVVITAIALIITSRSSQEALSLTKKQLEFQLRPFVSVLEEPSPKFSFMNEPAARRYWLNINYILKNFGVQPAHEYQRKSDKIMLVSFSKELYEEAVLAGNDSRKTVTERDKTVGRLFASRDTILEELYTYFKNYPDASFEEINGAFSSKGVYCYGDITEWFRPPTVILPNQPKAAGSTRDAGINYGLEISRGKCFLVYYAHISYEGAVPGRPYSTFYIGYYDEHESNRFRGEDSPLHGSLQEYRQWTSRDQL